MEVFWGLIRVMIWQKTCQKFSEGWYGWWYGKKTCHSLFITYLIVIFEVDLLLINYDCFSLSSPVSSLKIPVSHGEKWPISGKILIEYVIMQKFKHKFIRNRILQILQVIKISVTFFFFVCMIIQVG